MSYGQNIDLDLARIDLDVAPRPRTSTSHLDLAPRPRTSTVDLDLAIARRAA